MSSHEEMLAALQQFAACRDEILLKIHPMAAFVILSQMQLALRHRGNTGASRTEAEAICYELVAGIAPTPGPLRDLCLAGFDPDCDVVGMTMQ